METNGTEEIADYSSKIDQIKEELQSINNPQKNTLGICKRC